MIDSSVTKLATAAAAYLHEVLGARVQLRPWEGASAFPAVLSGRYRFVEAQGLAEPLLLMIDEAEDTPAAGTLRTQLDVVGRKWSFAVAYVRERLALAARRRLIEQRVPFLVPGNQLYLPGLGLDLRERSKSLPFVGERLRPATQAVFLHALLADDKRDLYPSALGAELGVSQMTVTRAFDELEAAGLITSSTMGRRRMLQWRFDRRETWDRAQDRLSDPVRTRRFVRITPGSELDAPVAGLDALARRSMIAAPPLPVVAIESRRWEATLAKQPGIAPTDPEDATVEVELWRYAPQRDRADGFVEPLSLALSLRDLADERVEQAVEQMLEAVRW